MQSSKYYDTVFYLKKEFTKSDLILYIGFILVTWSLLQISLTNFFENNDNILMKISSVYAQDDGGGKGNCEVSYDNGGSDMQEQSLDKEDTQEKYVGQEDIPGEITLSEDGSQDESVDISKLIGTGLSQLPSEDPQPLFVGLPPIPGGPLPPGSLPPIPGSPLPPGSPIPPGGGPTPPEDLRPLDEELRPLDDSHNNNDDDENDDGEEEEEEKEDEDEDNDDKDNN
jgi:hypothetical protein